MHLVEAVHREDVLGAHAPSNLVAGVQLPAVAHAEAREQKREEPRDEDGQQAEHAAVAQRVEEPDVEEREARGGHEPAQHAHDAPLALLALGLDDADHARREDADGEDEAEGERAAAVHLGDGGDAAGDETGGDGDEEGDDRAVGHTPVELPWKGCRRTSWTSSSPSFSSSSSHRSTSARCSWRGGAWRRSGIPTCRRRASSSSTSAT